jgi:glycosyltransferase involved in cell wall biosynthesis
MGKNNKILYITYDGLTDPLGQSQVLPYLSGLQKKGYQISIISCEKPERFKQSADVIQKMVSDAGLDWHPLLYHKSPPVLSTMYDVRMIRAKANLLHQKNNFTLVHCRSYIAALAGLHLKQKKGLPFIFDMRGFWADERVDGKIWNLKNPLFKQVYQYFKKKEKRFLEQADAIISLTENARDEIWTWPLKNQPLPIEVIPTCADMDLFDFSKINPQKTEALNRHLQIDKNQFVLGYTGSIGTWYLLDEMLLFFKQWLQHKPESVFLFVTKDDPDTLKSAARQHGIPESNLKITGGMYKDMPDYMALFDVSLFFIQPVFSKKASAPTKLGELMGMGIPVICNAGVGDVDRIVKRGQTGWIIDKMDETGFEKACEKVPALLNADKNSIREDARMVFSLDEGVKKLDMIYKRLNANSITNLPLT